MEAYRYEWRKPRESEVGDSQLVTPRADTTPLSFDQRGDSTSEGKEGSIREGRSLSEGKGGSTNEAKQGSANDAKEDLPNGASLRALTEDPSTNDPPNSRSETAGDFDRKEVATEVVYTSFSEVMNTGKDRTKKESPAERDRMIAATSLEREKRLLEVSQEVLSPVTARPPAALAPSRLGGLAKSMVSWGAGLRSGRRVEKIDLTGEKEGSTRVSLTELEGDEEEK